MATQIKIIHDVTACIYKFNSDKPVSKWSFQTRTEEKTKDKLVAHLKATSGLIERARELGIINFKVKLQYRVGRDRGGGSPGDRGTGGLRETGG